MSRASYLLSYKEGTGAVSMSGGYDVRTSGLILSLVMTQWRDGKTYHVDLRPVNRRDQPASCLVELPHSVEELNKIVKVLTMFKNCIGNGEDPEELNKVFSKEKEN